MIELNGLEIKPTIFPDKTSQVWKTPRDFFREGWIAKIQWTFENESEFMHVAQLVDYVKSMNAHKISLFMPYLPYARQDKEVSNESTFALRTFAKLVNSLELDEVECLDAHSDVAGKLINNFKSREPSLAMGLSVVRTKPDIICFPDAGAKTRYSELVKKHNLPTIYADKERDQKTGYIISYEIHGEVQDKSVILIDDLCDGGMTFILLTKELLKMGAKSVNLYVTHGIFSKGIGVLKEAGIDQIHTRKGLIE
jgi:ribose-phosphate pyrophosphokinase